METTEPKASATALGNKPWHKMSCLSANKDEQQEFWEKYKE